MKRHLPYYLTADGQRVPRLTRILGILREPDIDAKVLDTAAKRGTALHRMIAETIATSSLAKLPRMATWELKQAWHGWMKWWALQPKPYAFIGTEIPLVNAAIGYGATLDLLQHHRVTEWKATSRIRAKHWVQLHAQVPLAFGEAKRKEVSVRVVRLDPMVGDYEEQEVKWDEGVWQTFLKLKDVYTDWYRHEWEGHTDGKVG